MNRSKVLRRFLVSYLIVFTLPLIAGIFIYQVAFNIAENKSIQTSNLVLNQSIDLLEGKMIEIDRFTRLLGRNEALNRLLTDGNREKNAQIYDMRNLSLDLSTLSQSNKLLDDVYIYLNEQNVIIKPGSTYFRTNHFYEMNQYSTMSYTEWIALLQDGKRDILPLQMIETPTKNFEAITLTYPIPYNAIQNIKGTAVVIVDQGEVLELFNRITEEDNGWAYIVDSDGQLIARSGIEHEEIENINTLLKSSRNGSTFYTDDNLVISTSYSGYGDWTFIAGIPKKKILTEANQIRKFTFYLAIFTIVIGLLISLFLSYQNATPIKRLLKHVRLDQSHPSLNYKKGFALLEKNINQLIKMNNSLKADIDLQKPLLQSTVMYRILNGEFGSEKDIEKTLKMADIYFPGNKSTGIVAILDFVGYELLEKENEMLTGQTLHALTKNIVLQKNYPLIVTGLSHNKLVLIHLFNERYSKNANKNLLLELYNHLKTQFNLTVNFAVGSRFDKYNDMSRSFQEAKDALSFAQLIGDYSNVIYYNEIQSERNTYYYPLDIEIKIMNALKSGQHIEVCDHLEKIFDLNIQNRDLSPEMFRCFIQEIRATFFKELQTNHLSFPYLKKDISLLFKLEMKDDLNKIKNGLMDISKKHCQIIQEKRKEIDHQLVKDIMKFIQENYFDQNLSVTMICDYVKKHENYVTPLFKKYTHMYVSEYLERCRLESAGTLLITTSATMTEIADRCGYNSAHSFRRAFKRLFHLTPAEYRKYNVDAKPADVSVE